MIKVRGRYSWELIDKRCIKIGSGSKDNLITDRLIADFNTYNGFRLALNHEFQIVLSEQSLPLPVYEYREVGIAGTYISQDTVSPNLTIALDDVNREYVVEYTFPSPVSENTITIMGVNLRWHDGVSWQTSDFFSFTELPVAVVHKVGSSLRVIYRLSLHFDKWQNGHTNNSYVKDWLNSELSNNLAFLAMRPTRNDRFVGYSPFTQAVDRGMVARYIYCHGEFDSASATVEGATYAQTMRKTFTESQMVGVIGAIVWNQNAGVEAGNERLCIGEVVPALIGAESSYPSPQLAVNDDQVFYNPADPGLSKGTLTISGTLSVDFPVVVRVRIYKTGDASDVLNESMVPADVNPATDEFLMNVSGGGDWAVNDILSMSGIGSLPSPLLEDTDYFVAAVSGSVPTQYIKLKATIGGSVIDLTDAGSGAWTVIRVNTGEWDFEMEPWLQSNNNSQLTYQTQPFEDYDSNYFPYTETSDFSHPLGREGDYTYFAHQNVAGNRINISRWRNNSVESMEILKQLSGNPLTLRCAVRGKGVYADYVYIGTSNGLYRYDLTNPIAVSPVEITIVGIIDSSFQDLSWDEVTGELWSGHATGLCRINVGTLSATQYITSGALTGLSAAQVNIATGSMDAFNGLVLVAKPGASYIWFLVDGVGYSLKSTGLTHVHCGMVSHLYDGRACVVRYTQGERWSYFTVTGISGPGTGIFTEIVFQTGPTSQTVKTGPTMWNVQNNQYMAFVPYHDGSEYRSRYELWTLGDALRTLDYSLGGMHEILDVSTPLDFQRSTPRCPINVAGNNGASQTLDLWTVLSGIYMITPIFPNPVFYGYQPGTNVWTKGQGGRRQLFKTVSTPLNFGLSVVFNNAPFDWDEQYLIGESFTFLVSPIRIKTNNDTMSIFARTYYTPVTKVVDENLNVITQVMYVGPSPSGASPDVNFREMDILLDVFSVFDVTQGQQMFRSLTPSPGDNEYFPYANGRVDFNINDVGHLVRLNYHYTKYLVE